MLTILSSWPVCKYDNNKSCLIQICDTCEVKLEAMLHYPGIIISEKVKDSLACMHGGGAPPL